MQVLYNTKVAWIARDPFTNMVIFYPNINKYIRYKVWDEILCPFPNFNDVAVEAWDCVSNFIAQFTGHVITYVWSKLICVSVMDPSFITHAPLG